MGNFMKVLKAGNIGRLIASILISEGIGVVSALFTMNTMEKYNELQLPPLAPPGWVFPVVWGILFLLMGIASYMVWIAGIEKRSVRDALVYYGIQLSFNFFWTIIFFRFGARFLALLWIIALLFFILVTTAHFFKVKKAAAYLMIPYSLWVSFAVYLNYATWILNKGQP